MNQQLLALYGLKYNPFTAEVPIEALYVPPKVENFCWRIEQAHLREGGFALIHGDPGSGKSVVMRLLAELPIKHAGNCTKNCSTWERDNFFVIFTRPSSSTP
jgi:type II secretory pathway predicted ATPase ExeA